MWCGKRVSVILPTYNEKDSIRRCIEAFEATGVVDEILVVNNNAAAGTSEEVAKTSAREVHEPVQGYGAAIRRGFRRPIQCGHCCALSLHPDDFAEDTIRLCAEAGIAIRDLPGHPYLRVSVGAWNDESDLERLLTAL